MIMLKEPKKEVIVRTNGIGFFGLLAIVFITLKLTGYITWPWLWVLSPLWMPLAIVVSILLVVFVFAFLFAKR